MKRVSKRYYQRLHLQAIHAIQAHSLMDQAKKGNNRGNNDGRRSTQWK